MVKKIGLLVVVMIVLGGVLAFTQSVLAEPIAIMPPVLLQDGQLLDSFAFRNGDGVTAIYQDRGSKYLIFVYDDVNGETQYAEGMLPVEERPELVIVNICGRWARATVSWAGEHAQVYRFAWELPVDSGKCDMYKIYLSGMVGE